MRSLQWMHSEQTDQRPLVRSGVEDEISSQDEVMCDDTALHLMMDVDCKSSIGDSRDWSSR